MMQSILIAVQLRRLVLLLEHVFDDLLNTTELPDLPTHVSRPIHAQRKAQACIASQAESLARRLEQTAIDLVYCAPPGSLKAPKPPSGHQ